MTITGDPWPHPDDAEFRLVAVPPDVLHALALGADTAAFPITPYLAGDACAHLWRYRDGQVTATPTDGPWVTRLVFVPGEELPVGLAGFHGAPDVAGMVEIGYRIDPAHRRRGYARRALETLLDVARDHPEVHVVRATISPDNAASLALIADYGFQTVGEQWDDDDGLEIIFESSSAVLGPDWRVIDDVATAWFAAPSLTAAAGLAGPIGELPAEIVLELRPTGVRVRLDSWRHAEAVSAAARELGLMADPTVLQQVAVVVQTANADPVRTFWRGVLGYLPGRDGGLADPLRRDPALRIEASKEPRPLRHRVHVDVVRPAAVVEQARPGEPAGPFGVRHADVDGNEVDVVPGDPLQDAADWQVVFGAMAYYRVTSTTQRRDVASAAAELADAAGFPLLIDLRPGLVILDSGKDMWDADTHGRDVDFSELAAQVQAAARELGAVPEPEQARFVQLFFDAADVDAVRAFWLTALGYVGDRRDRVSDIHDPHRLNPELVFQQIDTSETDRLRQRNRFLFELAVPADVAEARVATIVSAGGQVLERSDRRWRIADPEGNELIVVAGT